MAQKNVIRVLASDEAAIEGVEVIPLAPWLGDADILWEGPLPICAIVSRADTAAFENSAICEFLAANSIDVVESLSAALSAALASSSAPSAVVFAISRPAIMAR